MSKIYELPLTRDYVANWGIKEAVRELIQNAIDSDSPFEYHYDSDLSKLRIISRFAALPVQSLLLGMTSKAHDDTKIGSFGEGYKIAMLVLTRCDRRVRVFNNGTVWLPHFAHSKQFDHETLHISERRVASGEPREGVVFEISEVFDDDMATFRTIALQMQTKAEIGEHIATPIGQILLGKPGHIYVGGLHITTHNDFKYGYNFNADQVTLERDRQTINGWDLFNATKNIWFAAEGHTEKIIEMIENNVPEMHYARYDTPDIVKEAVFAAFKAKNPNMVPVGSREELNAMIQRGITNVVYVHDAHRDILLHDTELKTATKQLMDKPKPIDVLSQWYEQLDCKLLTEHDRQSWEQLLIQASHWSV